ncbi:hypothetical protein Q5752_001261 [Cryptotrichosporon argae]
MVTVRSTSSMLVFLLSIFLPLALANTYYYDSPDYDKRSLVPRAGTTTGLSLCHTVSIDVPLNVSTCTTSDVPCSGILGCTLGTVTQVTTCTVSAVPIQVDIADNVCLCIAAGVLTPQSVAQIGAIIQANGTGVNELTTVLGGTIGYTAASLLNYITSVEPSILGSYQTSCVYPANSVPISCSTCGYTCADGFQTCGSQCIANTATCASGAAKRKLDDFTLDPNLRCPAGLTACLAPDTGAWNGNNFECIDTRVDIESCGACAYPLPNRPEGDDCTAIPHAAEVSCASSRCVVHNCDDGFVSNGTACNGPGSAASTVSTPFIAATDQVPMHKRNAAGAGHGAGVARKPRDSDSWKHLQVRASDLRAGKRDGSAARRARQAARNLVGDSIVVTV